MFSKYLLVPVAAFSLLALPATVGAHGSMKPAHGGVLTMSGETMLELVPTPTGADFYISDEDQPLAASGFTGTATVSTADSKESVPLVAEADNKMTAPGLRVPAGAKLVVALTGKNDAAKTFFTFMMK
jgi:hypothetical protein